MSPEGRKVKCLEPHPGESPAGPAPRPGLRVWAAAAAHHPAWPKGRGRRQGKAPVFRARRPFVPNTRGDPGSRRGQKIKPPTPSADAPGHTLGSRQEWPVGGHGGRDSPPHPCGRREPGVKPLVRVQGCTGGPCFCDPRVCIGSHAQFGRPRNLLCGPRHGRTAVGRAGPPVLRAAGFGTDAPQAPAPTPAPGISRAPFSISI